MALTVGAPCINGNSTATNSTRFNVAAANEDGTCSLIQIYPNTNMAWEDVASFYDDGGNFSTRAGYNQGLGITVSAGSCNEYTSSGGDFTAFSMTSGDYLGVYFSSGAIERNTIGGSGYRYATGDQIPASGVAFTLSAGSDLSLRGDDTGAGASAAIEIFRRRIEGY